MYTHGIPCPFLESRQPSSQPGSHWKPAEAVTVRKKKKSKSTVGERKSQKKIPKACDSKGSVRSGKTGVSQGSLRGAEHGARRLEALKHTHLEL